MHRCCPDLCQVQPVCTASECEKLLGGGNCIYPNQYSKGNCGESKLPSCLSDKSMWGVEGARCEPHYQQYCSSWSKDMHRCCPDLCQVDPVCTASECEKLQGLGTCTYPNRYSVGYCGGGG